MPTPVLHIGFDRPHCQCPKANSIHLPFLVCIRLLGPRGEGKDTNLQLRATHIENHHVGFVVETALLHSELQSSSSGVVHETQHVEVCQLCCIENHLLLTDRVAGGDRDHAIRHRLFGVFLRHLFEIGKVHAENFFRGVFHLVIDVHFYGISLSRVGHEIREQVSLLPIFHVASINTHEMLHIRNHITREPCMQVICVFTKVTFLSTEADVSLRFTLGLLIQHNV
mmetsp:Transcript_88645/g.147249  ORF Transcript_88645/g.147249 Transcript_88645/m.147249 type:complete len:225 (-) Transcript_88645:147-821(-)